MGKQRYGAYNSASLGCTQEPNVKTTIVLLRVVYKGKFIPRTNSIEASLRRNQESKWIPTQFPWRNFKLQQEKLNISELKEFLFQELCAN